MKYIRDHLMFIFPLLAILFGIESFLVFDRVTKNYEQTLREEYSILVFAHNPMSLEDFKKIDKQISTIEGIKKETIVEEMVKGMPSANLKEIMGALPHFYAVYLDSYLDANAIESIRGKLNAEPNIKKVETFGKSHNANYNLFISIKVVLWTFVIFISLTSLLLVIKQMEIWQLAHKERMQVMEIFGASTALRSGILFKMASVDAVIATIITSVMFALLRYVWATKSQVELLINKQPLLFQFMDVAILGGVAFLIVFIAVMRVVYGSRESKLT